MVTNNFMVCLSFLFQICFVWSSGKKKIFSTCLYFLARFLSSSVEAFTDLSDCFAESSFITTTRNSGQNHEKGRSCDKTSFFFKWQMITFLRVQMTLIQISGEMILEDSNLSVCEFVSLSAKPYACVLMCARSQWTAFLPQGCECVGGFLEPRCHLPPKQ